MKSWNASWIYLDQSWFAQCEMAPGLPPVIFKKELALDRPLKRATAYCSALGVYQVEVNGQRTDCHRLAPGWTDYHKRIQYQERDLTPFLSQGKNELRVIVGDGWYVGNIAITGRNQYGRYPLKLFLELELEYEDGASETLGTDGSWAAGTGAIQYSDLQSGERYDARQEEVTDWHPAEVCDMGTRRLVPQQGPELSVKEEVSPVSFTEREDSVVIDMGQNMVGVVRVRWRGERGAEAELVHGEMLRPDGSVYTENLRSAAQRDSYVFRGGEPETFEPLFTIHGFRYVEVFHVKREDILDVTGRVIYADVERTGDFACSNGKVNQLYRNIVWGQKGNFNSVPTDCPQRDERMGWTGDAQIFAKTACYNMDCHQYFRKYLTDMADAQLANGAFPDVVPLVRRQEGMGLVGIGHAAWGDAGIIIPWTLYRFYGDRELLADSYDRMARHMEYVLSTAVDGIRDDGGYGDWLSVNADTPKAVMATAFMAYCLELMAGISAALDKPEKKAYYSQALAAVKTAFLREFVDSAGIISGDTQACYVLALRFGLLGPELEQAALSHLKRRIRENGGRLSTGFVGVSYLLPVLCDYGETELAYDLLLQEEYPSWLYSVNNGATTVWERWNSYTYESGFADISMNSFNHYSLGSVGEWMFEYAGGIRQAEDSAGFEKLQIRPCVDPRLGWARVRYRISSGEIEVYWKAGGGRAELEIRIPQEAELILPDGSRTVKPAGTHRFSVNIR